MKLPTRPAPLRVWLLPACLLFIASLQPASAALRPWDTYRAILWMDDAVYRPADQQDALFDRLREMGVNTTMISGGANPAPAASRKFPYYVENLVNRGLCLKWNSKVRDWDKVVTDWAKTGRPDAALERDYCLDDPAWNAWARGEVDQIARMNREHAPVAYDLRDELSTTISANPFDYDFSPAALAGFRDWLRTCYPDLAALNAQWETRFASWADVRPFTTDQIKNRMASGDAIPRGRPDWQAVQRITFQPAQAVQAPTRWNLSPWCDFRSYMDLSLARALNGLRQAAHAADPATPVGIEGTQMPHAFGGYDLWRLSQALDWMEPYDIACSREILGSFMPGRPLLCTVFEKETDPAMRRLWHLLLLGDKGCIIWWSQDCLDLKTPGRPLTAKARALAPALREMTSPTARLFLRADRETDPVLIHYSQASIQAAWLIESTVDGSTWLRRFSSFEASHNRHARVRESWLKLFQDLGLSPRFVSTEQIERGALKSETNAIVVLPNSWALSTAETSALETFLKKSPADSAERQIACDGRPGLFDGHGRLQPRGPWDDRLSAALSQEGSAILSSRGGPPRVLAQDIAQYSAERLRSRPQTNWSSWAEAACGNLPRPVRVIDPEGGAPRARIHRFRLGSARLLAFERNISYQMSEDLKQAGGNEALEKPVSLQAQLAEEGHVYDLSTLQYLGKTNRFAFALNPWRPSLFAVLPAPVGGSLLEHLAAQPSSEPPASAAKVSEK